MHNNFLFKSLLFLTGILLFVSCDKEYSAVGDALIGDNNFELVKYPSNVVAYNEKITPLDPIESNNLPVNALGIYDNPAFGKTTANFATQLALATLNPTIGKNPEIESVYLDVPYFVDATQTKPITSTSTGITSGNTYVLDSIYGEPTSKMKLSVYESGLDMDNQVGKVQTFYTNQNAEFDKFKIGNRLNDDIDKSQNDAFFFNAAQNSVTTKDAADKETITYSAPSMRLKLNAAFFQNKIFNAPTGSLSNQDVFDKYFRGLYLKVEQSGADKGSLAMINFAKGTITIKYKEDSSTTPLTRVEKSLILNMTGNTNTVNLLEQSNPNTDYETATSNPNRDLGDKKLYLKGGEGSLAVINLFGSTDSYKYEVLKNANSEPVDEKGNVIPVDSNGNPKDGYFLTYIKNNTSNGISDELDDIRFPLIDDSPGQIYHSIRRRWLINDANLVFYIDATTMKDSREPERIYLYDYTNNTTILDYVFGTSTANKNTSKYLFGGFIAKDASKRGISYKVNITNHIRNLVKNAGVKNVQLGLVVTEDMNSVDFKKLKTGNAFISQAPKASVMNPLGTIIYGSNLPETDAKRPKLEISYTKPK